MQVGGIDPPPHDTLSGKRGSGLEKLEDPIAGERGKDFEDRN